MFIFCNTVQLSTSFLPFFLKYKIIITTKRVDEKFIARDVKFKRHLGTLIHQLGTWSNVCLFQLVQIRIHFLFFTNYHTDPLESVSYPFGTNECINLRPSIRRVVYKYISIVKFYSRDLQRWTLFLLDTLFYNQNKTRH